MFTSSDLNQIKELGISFLIIEKQVAHFIKGFPFMNLARPATPGDGIVVFDDEMKELYLRKFREEAFHSRIVKFVPASGAASRMFKHLFEFRGKYQLSEEGLAFYNYDHSFNSIHYLITYLEEIAFYEDMNSIMLKSGISADQAIRNRDFNLVIGSILDEKGLNYASLPKGLIKFHNYPDGARTAAEEHLVEAGNYARDNKLARIHFTISPEHKEIFNSLITRVLEKYESQIGVKFEISYSVQKPATDTLAVDPGNEPFRNADGSLLFRPGGHGALLENLNEIDADLVYIKNIDNIVPDRLKQPTFEYKQLIGGHLFTMRDRIFDFLNKAEVKQLTVKELDKMLMFAKTHLFLCFDPGADLLPARDKQALLVKQLNRPIRVCGMVKNEGEPGGGPFWVYDAKGDLSLQIVEASQINLKNPGQETIVNSSTHFNPVDLVCSIRDYKGNPFNLSDFVDEETGFISVKSSGGKSLKAQELPGLWNGAMARWITIFAEVPIITFNPVKTVNDLLRQEHLEGKSK